MPVSRILLLALVSGCSSSEERFFDRYAEAWCQLQDECLATDTASYDRCMSYWDEEGSCGPQHFIEDEAAACLDAAEAWSCEDLEQGALEGMQHCDVVCGVG